MTITTIALSNLVLSSLNMRQGDVDVSDLIGSMTARVQAGDAPLLQNLRVTMQLDADGAETGKAEVHVGGRRWRALNALVKAKVIKKTYEVPVAVCATAQAALEESLEENMVRLDPHPAEQYITYARLAETGMTVEQIAARYDQTELVVRRRLALGRVSPKLLDLYRQNQISGPQMRALGLTEDHAVQEEAWFGVEHDWQRQERYLRQRITKDEVEAASNQLASIVGEEAYLAAGGTIRRDLFADDGGAYFQDPALLESLALKILGAKQEEVKAEGWKWVEIHPTLNYAIRDQWGTVAAKPVSLSAEAAARVEELEAQAEAHSEAEDWEAVEVCDAEVQKIHDDAGEEYDPADIAVCGAVVTIAKGQVVVERGFICKAEAKARRAAEMKAERSTDGEGAGEPVVALSGKLREALSGEHTMAMRAAIAAQPSVALVAVVHRLLMQTHYNGFDRDLFSCVSLQGPGYADPMAAYERDLSDTVAGVALAKVREQMAEALPSEKADLWSFLLEQSQDRLLVFLAYASSGLINALQHGHSRSESVRSGQRLAQALSLDMADYWTATADNYFSRVGKPLILEAVTEVVGAPAAAGMASLKKGELAQRAEEALDGARWVPAIFRHSETEALAEVEDGEVQDVAEAA
ncbi:ParB/RepB/Spo0J family partition protein (plasmid) [Brevundimonas olei]|uniref:ParB/RepB/Spo0J family partition protein n=1 Tax=Brevundimonas olei TaxID=657642 RepID=A0ABZ2IG07_9CAUL